MRKCPVCNERPFSFEVACCDSHYSVVVTEALRMQAKLKAVTRTVKQFAAAVEDSGPMAGAGMGASLSSQGEFSAAPPSTLTNLRRWARKFQEAIK